MEALLALPLAAGLIAMFALLDAWVMSVLWGWFVVPFGVAQIGMAHAYGVTVLIGLLTASASTKQDDGKQVITRAVLRPFVCLLCGWIAHRLMVG